MPLSLRDRRACEFAKELAARRGSTMTQAIIAALEAEIAREREARPLRDRLAEIAAKAKAWRDRAAAK